MQPCMQFTAYGLCSAAWLIVVSVRQGLPYHGSSASLVQSVQSTVLQIKLRQGTQQHSIARASQRLPLTCKACQGFCAALCSRPQACCSASGASPQHTVLRPHPLPHAALLGLDHCWLAVWPQPAASSAPALCLGLPVESHQMKMSHCCPAPSAGQTEGKESAET